MLFPLFIFGQVVESGKISAHTAYFLSSIKNTDANDKASMSKLKKQFLISETQDESYISAFIKLEDNADLSLLESMGVKINTELKNIVTAQIPVSKLEEITLLQSVKRLEIASPVQKKMYKARPSGNVDKMHAGTDLPNPFTGKDVVVGIIDGGFEFAHINFYDSTASELRVKRVWNQNLEGTAPQGFSYGTEYSTTASIQSATTDDNGETHATHVTGIAAGADKTKNNNNQYHGIATESDLVLVSYDVDDNSQGSTSIIDGINYIYSYAKSVNKPAVVNMSLGHHIGPHDGTSLFDQAADELQGPGRLLVGAAGNEGDNNSYLHISKIFSSPTDTLKSFFGFFSPSILFGIADIWGETNKSFKMKVVVYNKDTNSFEYESEEFDASLSESEKKITLTSSSDGVSGSIYVYAGKNSENNRPNAYVYLENIKSINTGNSIGILITEGEGAVHGWTDANYSYFTSNDISGWTNGDNQYSVGEIGGTGKNIISVGAYVTTGSFLEVNRIASFSSRGPTLDGRVKPDITAPGSTLISSYSRHQARYANFYNTVGSTRYYYGTSKGTSMAAPFVTGVLATWMQAKKDLSPDEARNILQRTATVDTYTGVIPTEGSNTWGYGKINAYEGLKECIRLTSFIENNDADRYLISYPNPNSGDFKVLFLYKDSNVNFSVYNMNGRKVFSDHYDKIGKAEEFDVQLKLSKGMYLMKFEGKERSTVEKLIIQ